jgi:hypothetical protein
MVGAHQDQISLSFGHYHTNLLLNSLKKTSQKAKIWPYLNITGVKKSMKNKLILSTGLILFFSGYCFAEKEIPKPGLIKRRYNHSCPAGTEQVGDGPARSSIVFCRKPLVQGYHLEGDFVSFYRNGNKKIEGGYYKGKKDGLWRNFKKNGELATEAIYKNGRVVKKQGEEKKKVRIERQFVSSANRPFPNDRDVYNKLSETKPGRLAKGKASKTNLLYGISSK